MNDNYVNYEMLENAKNTYQKKADEIQTIIQAIVSQNGELYPNGWKNMTAAKFVERFNSDYKPSLEKVVRELNDIATFIGNYSFYSSGSVDLYADSTKIVSYPMNEEGEMSIAPATKPDEVMVIAGNDTSIGHVSDNYLLIEPTTAVEKFGEMDMNLSFTYGKATFTNRVLTFPTNVTITATYQDMTFSGYGQVDIVAIKK